MSPKPSRMHLAQPPAKDLPQAADQPQFLILIHEVSGGGYAVTPKSLSVPPGAQVQWHCNLAEPCEILFAGNPFFPVTLAGLSSSPVFNISSSAEPKTIYSYWVTYPDGFRHDPEIIIDPIPGGTTK